MRDLGATIDVVDFEPIGRSAQPTRSVQLNPGRATPEHPDALIVALLIRVRIWHITRITGSVRGFHA
jgi:hypothetical protein